MRQEYAIGSRVVQRHDFLEGVRAVIVASFAATLRPTATGSTHPSTPNAATHHRPPPCRAAAPARPPPLPPCSSSLPFPPLPLPKPPAAGGSPSPRAMAPSAVSAGGCGGGRDREAGARQSRRAARTGVVRRKRKRKRTSRGSIRSGSSRTTPPAAAPSSCPRFPPRTAMSARCSTGSRTRGGSTARMSGQESSDGL